MLRKNKISHALLGLLLGLTATISGCGSNTVFKPTPIHTASGAMLYIYRPEAHTPGLAKPLRFSYPEVFVDGKSVGVIAYNRYLAVELAAGTHQIRLTGLTERAKSCEIRDINRKITLQAGESSFLRFRVEYDLSRMNLGQPRAQYSIFLTPVREDDAVYEIRKTTPMR